MDNKSGCQYFVDFTVSDKRCGASTHDGGYVVQKHVRLGAYCGIHQHVIAERARINFPDRPVKLVPTHGEAVPA